MNKYEVREVVCDYGIFENGELKIIVNNKKTADAIVTLLELDRDYHKELQKDLVDVDETYVVPRVVCNLGKDTKTEECEWCILNSKCEIYKGD